MNSEKKQIVTKEGIRGSWQHLAVREELFRRLLGAGKEAPGLAKVESEDSQGGRGTNQRSGWAQSGLPLLLPYSSSCNLEAAEGRRGVGKTSQGQVLTRYPGGVLNCHPVQPCTSPERDKEGRDRYQGGDRARK